MADRSSSPSAVHTAVRDSLPDGVALKSLGTWRFRGIPDAVAMSQVEAPDLLGGFPPLRSAVPADS